MTLDEDEAATDDAEGPDDAALSRAELAAKLKELRRELGRQERARSRVEKRLGEAQSLVESVVENVPFMIFVKDAKDLAFVLFNRAGEELLGLERAAFIGKSDLDFFPKEQATFFQAKDREVLAQGVLVDIPEEPIQTATKGERLLHTKKVCIKSAEGAPQYLLGISEDITERKRVEEELRFTNVLFATQLAASIDGILVVSEDDRVLSYNESFVKLWGLPAELVAAKDDAPVLAAVVERVANPEAFLDKVRYLYAHREETSQDRIELRDGRTFDRYSAPIVADGRYHGRVWYFRDISELVRRTRELERSNHELEQFAYVASHDLQEPLRMVSSYTQLLAQRYRDKLDQDANDFIDYAVGGALRLQRLISDLLAYSRVGSQGAPLESIASRECLERAMANLTVAIAESGAQVSSAELPTVRADATQLTQVLQNLIGNAIKFRAVEPPRIQLRASRDVSAWHFSVADNGIGIAAAHQPRLFQIFQRLHGKDVPGTGIGLALCKRVVERHGGAIWLESEPGRGTTVHFTIPA